MFYIFVKGGLIDLFLSFVCNLPTLEVDLDNRAITIPVLNPKRSTTSQWEASRPNHSLKSREDVAEKTTKVRYL